MDDVRFAGWLRTLSTGSTRRGVLAALAALGGLELAALSGAANTKNKDRSRGLRGRRRRSSASSAPQSVPDRFDLPPRAPFCTFPVHVEITGKTKTIELPGHRTLITAPGMDALLTNLDTGQQVRLNITGAAHTTVEADGDQVTVATGRNVLIDPVVEPHFGLTRGRFTYAFDETGTLIQARSGRGHVTNVCTLLT